MNWIFVVICRSSSVSAWLSAWLSCLSVGLSLSARLSCLPVNWPFSSVSVFCMSDCLKYICSSVLSIRSSLTLPVLIVSLCLAASVWMLVSSLSVFFYGSDWLIYLSLASCLSVCLRPLMCVSLLLPRHWNSTDWMLFCRGIQQECYYTSKQLNTMFLIIFRLFSQRMSLLFLFFTEMSPTWCLRIKI